MNDINKIFNLISKMNEILLKNNWKITIEKYDGSKISGILLNQNIRSEPFKVTIELQKENKEVVNIDFNLVKSITA